MFRLRVSGGDHDGEIHSIENTLGATIGRSSSNSISLRDSKVSRTHCQIRLSEDGFIIADLQSTNGTYVNGERINEQPLNVGDEVRVGNTMLRLEMVPDDNGTAETQAME
jgi:pSer/pThr/pTyr-binding forkhead associated (FHA) protein